MLFPVVMPHFANKNETFWPFDGEETQKEALRAYLPVAVFAK